MDQKKPDKKPWLVFTFTIRHPNMNGMELIARAGLTVGFFVLAELAMHHSMKLLALACGLTSIYLFRSTYKFYYQE
jgi:hypothetical protein